MVEELEEIERHGVVAVVNGADDGLDGLLDVVDVWAERAGTLLGVRVGHGDQQDSLRGRLLHELEVPQPGLLLLGRPLHRHLLLRALQQNKPQISTKSQPKLKSRNKSRGEIPYRPGLGADRGGHLVA